MTSGPLMSGRRHRIPEDETFPTRRGRVRGPRIHANSISTYIRNELSNDRIYLVPLRLFIGIGWLRAFAEKAVDSGWRDGTAVVGFLNQQMETGQIVFPAYQTLVTEAFLPHATALAWIIMVGQLLAGVAIVLGGFTSAGLLGGLFMNLNFLFAGATEPSVFYIVIQLLLLLMGAGAVLGVDQWLSRTVRQPLLVAQPNANGWCPLLATRAKGVMLIALAVAGFSLAHVTDWSPGGSVHDPAAVMVVLASLGAGWSMVALLQTRFGQRSDVSAEARGGTGSRLASGWRANPAYVRSNPSRTADDQNWSQTIGAEPHDAGYSDRPVGSTARRPDPSSTLQPGATTSRQPRASGNPDVER